MAASWSPCADTGGVEESGSGDAALIARAYLLKVLVSGQWQSLAGTGNVAHPVPYLLLGVRFFPELVICLYT